MGAPRRLRWPGPPAGRAPGAAQPRCRTISAVVLPLLVAYVLGWRRRGVERRLRHGGAAGRGGAQRRALRPAQPRGPAPVGRAGRHGRGAPPAAGQHGPSARRRPAPHRVGAAQPGHRLAVVAGHHRPDRLRLAAARHRRGSGRPWPSSRATSPTGPRSCAACSWPCGRRPSPPAGAPDSREPRPDSDDVLSTALRAYAAELDGGGHGGGAPAGTGDGRPRARARPADHDHRLPHRPGGAAHAARHAHATTVDVAIGAVDDPAGW